MFPITAPLGDFLQCDLRNRSKKIWNGISSRRIPPHWGHWQPIWSPTKQHGTYVFLNSVTLPAFSLVYHRFALVIGIYDSHYPAADRRRLLVAHQDNRATPVRAVASEEARGNSCPLPPPLPRPAEPDKSSLLIDLFSLGSVILIIVTSNCLPFSYSGSIFRRHISWQMLKIAFQSLLILKISWGGYPQTPPTRLPRLLLSALAIMPPSPPPLPPRYKRPSYGTACTGEVGRRLCALKERL